MNRLIGLAIAAAFVGPPAIAADIYSGTIGAAEVVVVLDTPQDGHVGRYFYRRSGADITLNGTSLSGPELTLTEQVETRAAGAEGSGTTVSGYWRLTRQGEGFVGEWRARPGAAALPVRLLMLARPREATIGGGGRYITSAGEDASDYPGPLVYMYERARTPTTLGPERQLGAGAYRMVTDPRTAVAWPQLTRFPGAEAMTRLNEAFDGNRAIAVSEAQECADSLISSGPPPAGRGRPRPGGPTIRLRHIGVRLVSLTTEGSIFCGGAHPSNFFANVTYDATTGRVFDPAQLLRLDTAARRSAFERLWRGKLAARLRANRRAVIAECPIIAHPDQAEMEGLSYRLSDTGLVVTATDPSGAGAACNQDLAELTLAELAPFLAPGAAAYWR